MSTVKICDKCQKQISSDMVLRPMQVMAGDSNTYLFVTARSYNQPTPRGEVYYEEKDYFFQRLAAAFVSIPSLSAYIASPLYKPYSPYLLRLGKTPIKSIPCNLIYKAEKINDGRVTAPRNRPAFRRVCSILSTTQCFLGPLRAFRLHVLEG